MGLERKTRNQKKKVKNLSTVSAQFKKKNIYIYIYEAIPRGFTDIYFAHM